MNDIPVETQAKDQILHFIKGNWVKGVVGIIILLVGSYSNTYVRDRAKDEIRLAGGVSQETYLALKGEVDTLQATVHSLEAINNQQDIRLNASIDRLDNVIDAMIRSARDNQ